MTPGPERPHCLLVRDFGHLAQSAPNLIKVRTSEREVRKTVPRAVFLSALLIGLFYVFCYYAATVYFGPDKMADPKNGFLSLNGGDPWSGMAQNVWGPGIVIVILAVLNSAIANANAGENAATRVGYSLARIGLLPRMPQKIHPRFRTPYVEVNVQALGGIILAVALGLAAGGPLPAFALLGTIATIIVICIYILTNISNVVFYTREKRGEFNLFLNLIVPVVGSLIFLPALVASFGIDFFGLGITPLTAPANLAPYIILVWMLIGIGGLVYFLRRDPTRIAQTGAFSSTKPPRAAVRSTRRLRTSTAWGAGALRRSSVTRNAELAGRRPAPPFVAGSGYHAQQTAITKFPEIES